MWQCQVVLVAAEAGTSFDPVCLAWDLQTPVMDSNARGSSAIKLTQVNSTTRAGIVTFNCNWNTVHQANFVTIRY